MPFYHILPCLLGTFAPSYLAYHAFEDNASRLKGPVLRTAKFWVLAHVVMALLVATFLPTTEEGSFSVLREIGQATIGAGDLVGIWYALDKTKAPTNVKLLSVGFGWALLPLLFSVFPLIAASREPEFDWATNLQLSVRANVDICASIALTALVWLFGVQQKHAKASGEGGARSPYRSLVLSLAAAHLLLPACVAFLRYKVGLGSWSATAAYAVGVVGLCAGSWAAFSNNQLKRQRSA